MSLIPLKKTRRRTLVFVVSSCSYKLITIRSIEYRFVTIKYGSWLWLLICNFEDSVSRLMWSRQNKTFWSHLPNGCNNWWFFSIFSQSYYDHNKKLLTLTLTALIDFHCFNNNKETIYNHELVFDISRSRRTTFFQLFHIFMTKLSLFFFPMMNGI